jgi:5-methylcytosine-specific restriction endonuclease McrA
MRDRRAANPEAHRASIKRSTERHYEKKLERNKTYRAKNPDKVRQWKKKDRQINKARILADNAKRRSFFAGETSPQIRQLYALRDFYRSMSLGDDFHVDHIIPISKGGLHLFENMQVIPAICNLRKGAKILGMMQK